MNQPIIIFASGSKDGGGSGFQELVESTYSGILREVDIVAVVSNHEHGGVAEKAEKFGISFEYWPGPWDAEGYQKIVEKYNAKWILLSGWLKRVSGLDPQYTFNIHPGPLPQFGGAGMYGKNIHESVIEAYKKGEVESTAVSMHFVTGEYDQGPTFFHFPVIIHPDDTAQSLAERVNKIEHAWQPYISNLVIHQKISWDGINPSSLVLPEEYELGPR